MRFKIINFFLVSGIILLFSSGCKKGIPKTPYILIPESTYTGAKTILSVFTTDPNKDRVYYIVDWGDEIIDTFPSNDTIPLFRSGDTVPVYHIYEKWTPPRTPEFKNFEVRATAKDEKGNIQKIWSEPETIKVIYNEEPNRPKIFSRYERGGMNTLQSFGATTIDPEGDSVAIHFSFFSPDSWTKFHSSGDTISPSNDTINVFYLWVEPGIKQIWAIAKDKKGSLSISSETLKFEVLDEGYVKGVFHAIGLEDTAEIQSSPAIATIQGREKIFIGSEGNYAYIIDAATMRADQRIRHIPIYPDEEEPWGNSATVDVFNQRWYIANDQGEAYALGFDGGILWHYPVVPGNLTGWSFTDAAFDGNNVYVATADTLYALDGTSGLKLWGYSIPNVVIKTAPIIDVQGNVYIGDDSGWVRKINGTTGELIWQHDLGKHVPTSGAIDNITGIIYFGVNDVSNSYLCALTPDSGALQWSFQIDDGITNSPVIGTDGYIYFGDEQGRIYAVKDGFLKSGFPIELNSSLSTPAFATDGYFYIMNEDLHVFCINSLDGSIRWDTPLPAAAITSHQRSKREDLLPSPVIGSDGDIYVAAGASAYGLYRLQGRSSNIPANTPWPMFRHDRNHSGKAGFIPSRKH